MPLLRTFGLALEKTSSRNKVVTLVTLIISIAFTATAVLSFVVSRNQMRDMIVSEELPMTSDTIYSEIQHDFIKPVQASGIMAGDTFLRDWALDGEQDLSSITKYLAEFQQKNDAFTAYFVSDKTRRYYTSAGVFKSISEQDAHDIWFFQIRDQGLDYRIDVDTDQTHDNAVTIFINYRVYDYQHNFIGICGLGLNMNTLRQFVDRYEQHYGRKIYFVDPSGKVLMAGAEPPPFADLGAAPALAAPGQAILDTTGKSLKYLADGQTHLLNIRYIPELKWYLFVERIEELAVADIRNTLYINLLIALVATMIVAAVVGVTIGRFHDRLEHFAATDGLTGLTNRRACEILLRQEVKDARRAGTALSLVMVDIDHFKRINDRFGHPVGDTVIKRIAATLRTARRDSDVACRWGGEELLLLLPDCTRANAVVVAGEIRAQIQDTSFGVGDDVFTVTISAGVAELQPDETEQSLLSRVDNALYAAKRAGRNRVVADGAAVATLAGV